MRLLLLAAAAALTACATPCPPGAGQGPVVRHYECATGVSITVTFLPDPPGAQIEQEGFPTITLQQAPSGAGFRYRRGSVEFRGNDQEGRLSRAGGGELRCLVTGTPS